MKRYIFIDGTNLYGAQYELFGPQNFLYFPTFIDNIQKELNVHFNLIYFYASYSPQPTRTQKSVPLYIKNESKFYSSVKKAPFLIFKKGYRSKLSRQEKGVDVSMSVDMVHMSHLRRCDHVYIISGDADFIPAIQVLKEIGIKTTLICLENKIMREGVYRTETFVITFDRSKRFVMPKVLFLNKKSLVQQIDRH